MTKIWDKNKYITVKAYCREHDIKKDYTTIIKQINDGVPPIIAIYHKINNYNKDWAYSYRGHLYWIALDIFNKHKNLIEDTNTKIDIYTYMYISSYLAPKSSF